MREYAFSILIALLFTAVLSCSENKKEQKALQEVQVVQERARETLEKLRTSHDSLQTYLAELKKEHDLFSEDAEPDRDEEHNRLWTEYQRLVDRHRELVIRFENFHQDMASLRDRVDEGNSTQVIEETKKIHAEIASYVKQNDDMLNQRNRIEEKHEEYLYGHRTDVH